MASRTSRSRKAPKRKRNRFFVHGRWITVSYFKGYEKRHLKPDHIDIMHWRGDGSERGEHIPRNVLKIDERYVAETPFLVKIFAIETMRKWTRRGDNERLPPYQEQRKYLKQQLCLPGPAPDYVERREWNEEHQLHVWYVRGDIVRQYFDPHFIFGGHDLVYGSYITMPRTVWIDVCQDEREIAYTLLHEMVERRLMERGWSYAKAHAKAIEAEMSLRYAEYDSDAVYEVVSEPLPVEAIEQMTDAGCGPTALAMLLDHDGIKKPNGTPWTEADLIELCGCDPAMGTDHEPLVRAVRSIVGEAFTVGVNGTLDDLRRLVLEERRPVLVGWWNGAHRTSEEVQADPEIDEGHYGVVKHVTTHVWLADSWIVHREGPGDHKVRLKEFAERWYDMDGTPTENDPGYRRVNGWHLYLHAKKG